MALDYSKLSEKELEAIANNDYSQLSDATLQQLVDEPAPAAPPEAAPEPVPVTAPAETSVSQAEADRNELLGLGALGAGGAAAGAAAYKLAPKAYNVAKQVSPTVRAVDTGLNLAKNVYNRMSEAPRTPAPRTAPTSPILDAQGRPMVRGPVAPAATAAPVQRAAQTAAAAEPAAIAAAKSFVRNEALQRIMKSGGEALSSAGKFAGKRLGPAGVGIGAYDAYRRGTEGDITGAALAGASALAGAGSMLTAPLAATGLGAIVPAGLAAVSGGLDVYNLKRDYDKQKEDEARRRRAGGR